MPVSFQDILFAYEFVAGSDLGEHQAFLCRRTGEIYSHSDLGEVEDEQLPEDVGDEEKYAISILASRWCWTLPANACRTRSTRCEIFSTGKALTGIFEPC
jgi:hypothetical protein